MTLKAARLEIINGIKTVKGIRSAPTQIPEGTNPFPFAVAHAATGIYTLDAAALKVGLHDIMVELHVSRDNLAYDYDSLETLVDLCVNKWMNMLKLKGSSGGFQTIHHFEQISYSIEPGQWAATPTLAVIFILEQCKVQDVVA